MTASRARFTSVALLVAGLLLAYGSVSVHWFDDHEPALTSYQGLFAAEVCGTDLGGDRLEKYEHAREGHVEPAVWRCEHEVMIAAVTRVHGAAQLLQWLGLLVGLVAGLATAVMAVVAGVRGLGGRRPGRRLARAIAITPLVGLASALVALFADPLGSLSYGAGSYAAGTVLAVIAAFV
jgi:hypothetical protein